MTKNVIVGIIVAIAIGLSSSYYEKVYRPYQIYKQRFAALKVPCPVLDEWLSAATRFGGVPTGDGMKRFERQISAFNARQSAILREYRREFIAIKHADVPEAERQKLMSSFHNRLDAATKKNCSKETYSCPDCPTKQN